MLPRHPVPRRRHACPRSAPRLDAEKIHTQSKGHLAHRTGASVLFDDVHDLFGARERGGARLNSLNVPLRSACKPKRNVPEKEEKGNPGRVEVRNLQVAQATRGRLGGFSSKHPCALRGPTCAPRAYPPTAKYVGGGRPSGENPIRKDDHRRRTALEGAWRRRLTGRSFIGKIVGFQKKTSRVLLRRGEGRPRRSRARSSRCQCCPPT